MAASTGDEACTAAQKAFTLSGEPRRTHSTVSLLASPGSGDTSWPSRLRKAAAKAEPASASAVTLGARNSPCARSRVCPSVGPRCDPSPGAVRRVAASSTRSLLPTTYPPDGAMPPPGFFIRDPAAT